MDWSFLTSPDAWLTLVQDNHGVVAAAQGDAAGLARQISEVLGDAGRYRELSDASLTAETAAGPVILAPSTGRTSITTAAVASSAEATPRTAIGFTGETIRGAASPAALAERRRPGSGLR